MTGHGDTEVLIFLYVARRAVDGRTATPISADTSIALIVMLKVP
jgi:hypothetical protein